MRETESRAILLDIEGTTTPVEFVYEILFPFARRHLREFIQRHYRSDDVSADLALLQTEHDADVEKGREPPVWQQRSADLLVNSVTEYLYWLMDQDRKSRALKSLQGKIWEAGYLSGDLLGQVYPDVLPAFKRWQEQRRAIHIFSSGSVLAQKLLFAHTGDGDLTGYISDYFDTTTGAKTDAASYQSISQKIGLPAAAVLFVSDVTAELDAAQDAGMRTALCMRPGSREPESPAHPIVQTFDVIFS
jgi:enolase-phosphatase E1